MAEKIQDTDKESLEQLRQKGHRWVLNWLYDVWDVFARELRRIFHDSGVVLLFCIATLLYPFIFAAVYHNECVRDLPMAVVDDADCTESERFTHKLNATPEVNICYHCSSMAEAERLMQQRKINGIIYFPSDYGKKIAGVETARACLFCDMSSFLYYRSVMTGASNVLVDEMKHIETDRFGRTGLTGESAEQLITPIPYDDVKLFLPNGGFTSFLLPALLILVIHQTMFLGIGILYGTTREENLFITSIPARLRRRRSIYRVTVGRSLAYLGIYVPMSAIVLIGMPLLFRLPHIGQLHNLVLFLLPFLLATTFFCMTICNFVRSRDSGILTGIFFSVILLFLSGAIWPQHNMPKFWLYFSYLFPSTHGIQGYIRINSMGASLEQVSFEYLMLWGQAIFYFITSCITLRMLHRYHGGRKTSEIV